MNKDDLTGTDDLASLESQATLSSPPALELAPDKYLDALADLDISEAQKVELLRTLWSIMQRFVELGFSVDVCQHVFGKTEDGSDLPEDRVQ